MSGIAHEQELQHQVLPELLPDGNYFIISFFKISQIIAPWKKIQQNTFTRWVNKHLASANTHVYDLVYKFQKNF